MGAKEDLATIAKKLDKIILEILDAEIESSQNVHHVIPELLEYSSAIADGGKRLRGAFVYYGYLMHGGTNLEEILNIAAAIELSHAYLLIHDDIMDKAEFRRGTPTLHKTYRNLYFRMIGKRNDIANHFGKSIALCAGDIMCHLASEVLTNADFPAENKIKALSAYHRLITETGYGQVLDVFLELNEAAGEEDIIRVHHYKTGEYTYQNPLQIGALLAGATDEELHALKEYAIPGGIAFQLQDDILGMYGDEGRIGKPASSDLKEGKRTLLIIKALEQAKPHERIIIENALGNSDINLDTLEAVRSIIKSTGSLKYSKDLAIEYVQKAKQALIEYRSENWVQEGVDFLNGIADYMIKRDL